MEGRTSTNTPQHTSSPPVAHTSLCPLSLSPLTSLTHSPGRHIGHSMLTLNFYKREWSKRKVSGLFPLPHHPTHHRHSLHSLPYRHSPHTTPLPYLHPTHFLTLTLPPFPTHHTPNSGAINKQGRSLIRTLVQIRAPSSHTGYVSRSDGTVECECTFFKSQSSLPSMQPSKRGRLINTSVTSDLSTADFTTQHTRNNDVH